MDNYDEVAKLLIENLGLEIIEWYGSNTLQLTPFGSDEAVLQAAEKLINADIGMNWVEGEERVVLKGDDPEEVLDNVMLNLTYMDNEYMVMLFVDGEVHFELLNSVHKKPSS